MGNTRGIGRVVHQFQQWFLPGVPFGSDAPSKGWWERLAASQPHVWRHYRIPAGIGERVTVVVLSDLHVGSHSRDMERFERIVSEVAAAKPDALVLPGDFVNMQIFGGGRVRPESVAEILRPLAQRVPSFAVLGNHDDEYGKTRVAAALEACGVTVLANGWCPLARGPAALNIVGLEDHSTGHPDAVRAFAGISDLSRCVVIAHDPASFAIVPHGPIVTICGHTHGGQVCLPGIGPIVNASDAPLRWTHGHVVEAGRHLVVSAGLGTSGVPLRLRCPPEIVSVSLEPIEAVPGPAG